MFAFLTISRHLYLLVCLLIIIYWDALVPTDFFLCVNIVGKDLIKTDLTCQRQLANTHVHGEVKRTAEQIIKGVR